MDNFTRYGALLLIVGLLSGCSASPVQPRSGYPVEPGQVGPIHPDNPLQQPFACTTEQAGLGAPLVDNQQQLGQQVRGRFLMFSYSKGYSRYCGAPMRVEYFYRRTDGEFVPLPAGALPDDLAYIERDGEPQPFIVRLERGVLNRFIYATTMLVPAGEKAEAADSSLWNGRLLMFFNGGIGIGHKQAGSQALKTLGQRAPRDPYLFSAALLERGYAVTTSSGMTTDTTYNLPLLGQTAEMVKRQFVARYGRPSMTLALGGSGGAIQALYNSRHSPGLLDGLVVSHLFPDLLSQINGVGDCELLEYYFDRGHAEQGRLDPFWADWRNRRRVEGFNALNDYPHIKTDFDGDGRPMMSTARPGASTCTEGWRLAGVPVFFNPTFLLPFEDQQQPWIEQDVARLVSTRWSHWDDAVELYGRQPDGYAGRTYDNVGVQYGLQALRDGKLDIDRFLHLNARVGGWLPPAQMRPEAAPYYPYGAFTLDKGGFWNFLKLNLAMTGPGELWQGSRNLLGLAQGKAPGWLIDWLGDDDRQSVWSHYNATAWQQPDIAGRSPANRQALSNAERHGLVFRGQLDKPTIALLLYQDQQLDIHDARQPFIVRERIARAGGNGVLFSIWGQLPGQDGKVPAPQLERVILEALAALEQWHQTGVKPAVAGDRCWDDRQRPLAAGAGVWQGINGGDGEPGECARRFRLHGNPRIAAGESFTADTLKCRLKPVARALQDGTYGPVRFDRGQQAELARIFPDGVCDYSRPGLERLF
ncbi:DUF6351 family protein [Marinobacterium arenosum]|uniref:DUF6351 family protein n=1 Tax=Marinobacterium arenosum TaxID=2862496 RepID=UPI001C98C51D|nr:DUF6351 family protein [Marinobacterium arenosum]MBY4678823.1 hypothetical protein [Marinobacterium arenosum]